MNDKFELLTIVRFAYGDTGTFGSMYMPDGTRLYTVERPWLDNRPSVSCIPEGNYWATRRRFFRGGYDAVEILDVPSRRYILFHIANYPKDVEGCIGVGTGIAANMVTNSKVGFAHFMRFVPEANAKFKLTITHFEPPVASRVMNW